MWSSILDHLKGPQAAGGPWQKSVSVYFTLLPICTCAQILVPCLLELSALSSCSYRQMMLMLAISCCHIRKHLWCDLPMNEQCTLVNVEIIQISFSCVQIWLSSIQFGLVSHGSSEEVRGICDHATRGQTK